MKKVPIQGRSRQTVDALIEATARTIADRGWQSTTTNHIAAKAGVSVGSLYQYFDSREDLLAALAQREQRRILEKLDEAIAAAIGADARTAIRTLLEVAFKECEQEEALFTELANHWGSTGAGDFADVLDVHMLDGLRLFLSRFYDVYEPIDAPTVSFMLTNSSVMVISRFYVTRPRGVTPDKLLDEMTELYAGYFERKVRPRA